MRNDGDLPFMKRVQSANAPSISIIINTNARCASLMRTVAALDWQIYKNFELCLVIGPTDDGTLSFAKELEKSGRIKLARCATQNLSRSRNIGLELAAGKLIAFLDDDAIPEPVWLAQMVKAFDDSEIAGASGLVFQPNGRDLQFRFSLCDRFGEADHELASPADDHAYPNASRFPHVMGANCIFRRDALIAVGGFDEEFDYYLEEADICCRLVDTGYKICQLDQAPVHHKYLSGATRDGEGITVRRRSIIKNQIYFSLKNARRHSTLSEIIERSQAFIHWHRKDIQHYVDRGALHVSVINEFEADVEDAWEVGIVQGLTEHRKLRQNIGEAPLFRSFQTSPVTGEVRHIAVVLPHGDEWSASANAYKGRGKIIRTFTRIDEGDRLFEGLDLKQGLWCHRIPLAEDAPKEVSKTAFREAINRVAAYHPFDQIEDLSDCGFNA